VELQLFPERYERRTGWILPTAIIVSLLLHVLVSGAWILFGHRVVPLVAKLLPRPSPTPEIVALSDAITIEKRTVPPPRHRSRPRRAMRTSRAQPQRIAALPAPQTIQVPTLAPIPTSAPTAVPTREPSAPPTLEPTSAPTYPARGTIHHPRSAPPPEPRKEPPPPPQHVAQKSSSNAFSPQQIAALDAQFQHTIDSAQRSLTEVPPQKRPPARNPQALRYEQVMAGTPEQFLAAQGECDPLQANVHGPYIDRWIRCLITYSDGYFEEVSFPWPFHFTRRNDPFQYVDDHHTFPMQAPPAGFPLPHPFALSRAICSFYRAECQDVINRERANGNQPATDH